MEFKSKICTTIEQSKRLLELGLKKETADMVYQEIGVTPFNKWAEYWCFQPKKCETLSLRISRI